MDWGLFIGIIILQQVTHVSLSCRDQTVYVTEHEWEEIFQNNQHVYNDVRAVECVYRCMTLEHQIFEAVSDVTSRKCSCLSDSLVVGAAERVNNIPVLVVNLRGTCNSSIINDLPFRIPDNAITASSSYPRSFCAIRNIRLPVDDISGTPVWCAGALDLDQWVEVDFGALRYVTGILIRGRETHNQFIKTFTIQFWHQTNWIDVTDPHGNIQVFTGGTAPLEIAYNELSVPVKTTKMKIKPVTFQGYISGRIDILGC